jgi:hypothetical protein
MSSILPILIYLIYTAVRVRPGLRCHPQAHTWQKRYDWAWQGVQPVHMQRLPGMGLMFDGVRI